MLSTVLSIGGIVALIGGAVYLVWQYIPYINDFWNQITILYNAYSNLIPDWLAWIIPIVLLVCPIGLLVKLL